MHLIEIKKMFFISKCKHVCPQFVCSELSLKTAHEHLSSEFLNVHKNNMERKSDFGGWRKVI